MRTKCTKILTLLLVFVSAIMIAQIQVSGVVKDADGEPLPGAYVESESGESVETGIDGTYTITANEGEKLTFSFIGMDDKVQTVSGSSMNIMLGLDGSNAIDEVVVTTAAGIVREDKKLTYSVGVVEGDEITKAREANVVNSLSGKVAGVNITQSSGTAGGSTKIILRGESSLSGGNQPIFVIDGVPISNESYSPDNITGNVDIGNRAGDINPDDIESVSVLKGAAATALYGARAANGAIVITTKKGKRGSSIKVDVSSSMRFDQPLRLPDYQNEYAQGTASVYDKNSLNGWGPKISDVQGQLFEDFKGDMIELKASPNNVEDFYKTGTTMINSVSISGGGDNSDIRLSYSNLNQEGIIPESKYVKNNFSINTGRDFSEKFSGRFNLTYTNSRSTGRPQQGSNDPNVLVSKITGLPRTININDLRNNYVDEAGNAIGLSERTNNPYWIINNNPFSNDLERFTGGVTLNYKLLPWIILTNRFGLDTYNEDRSKIYAKGTIGELDGAFTIWDINEQIVNNDFMVNIDKDLNDKFNLRTIVGANIYQREWERITNDATDLTVAGLYTLANAQSHSPTQYYSKERLFGLYGDITLSYDDMLFLGVTGRNDWSSTLPVNNRSYFYPSVSLGFIFSELFENKGIMNFGKLRASYAEVGSATDPYAINYAYNPASTYFVQYSLSNKFPQSDIIGFSSPRVLPNENLKPQRKKEFEIGADLRFFKNRIRLDATYYDSRTVDQIVNIDVPLSTGYFSKAVNVGEVKNTGIEVMLDLVPFKTKSFKWNTTFNFAKNKQTVEELAPGLNEYVLKSGWSGLQIKAAVGESLSLYGTGWKRNENGDIIINETTGLRETESGLRLGNVNPDWTLGINNNFRFKNFTLGFLIDIKQGGKLFSGTVASLRESGLAVETLVNRGETFIDKGVIEVTNTDGTVTYKENDIPVRSMEDYWGQVADTSNTEGNVFDASYVKLREVSLSYQLPTELFSNSFIKAVSVGVEGRNLWIIDDHVPHIDPETNFFGAGSIGGGVEFNSVPSTRSFGFNLQMTF